MKLGIATVVSLAAALLEGAEPKSLCDVAEVLQAYDGETVSLRGELAAELSNGTIVLRANCEPRRRVKIGTYGRASSVHLDTTASSDGVKEATRQLLAEFQAARDEGRNIQVTATVSGTMEVLQQGDFSLGYGPGKKAPAAIRLAAISNVAVTALPSPEDLPVIPICDLFGDLPAFRNKRVAVQGEIVWTMEGAWVWDQGCEGGFVTHGFRWPVSISIATNDYALTEEEGEDRKVPRVRTDAERSSPVVAVGRVRMLDTYWVWCQDNRLHGLGLGHLGGAAAELLLETLLPAGPVPPKPPENRRSAAQPTPEERCTPGTGYLPVQRPVQWETASANLLAAIRAGDTDAVEANLLNSFPGRVNPEALPLAVRFGNPKMVRLLIAKGAYVHASGPLGPPVHVACLYERWDNLQALLKAGANIDAKDADGRTTLVACGIASVDALGALLRSGVDVNAEIHGKPAPLAKALARGSPNAVVEALLRAGATAYAADGDGDTPLHHAVRARRAGLIPLLLAHGAVATQRNSAKLTPLDLAYQIGAYVEAGVLRAR